ncbi:unnamed protein product [Closterium sp. NIES-53]
MLQVLLVAVSLADPPGGPVLAHSSTVLPCPAAPSGLLSGLHLPSFSTNLVSGADLQDAWVDQFTPGGQRVTHCTCSRTGRHLVTFTRRPGSSLYTLTTAPPPVPASGQVAASSQVFSAASRSSPASAPCSCRPLAHETLLWHHRLGHPSLPHLRGMASRALVSGLPRSLPPLPPGPAPTCVPCVEGRQRATPHSSSFPPTEAPLQTLHMDVWGPARVCGQGHERYFLLVVDDYLRYTIVFPLRSKDGGGEFSFDLLRAFCRLEGIRQTFTLPASPQQNGIAERRIGMVIDVARTSMIHAAAPHFLWPFVVQYAAHQINLQPRVSLPETTPTLRWTGKVCDASAFRVWGSRAFVRDTSADKLSSRAIPCVFLGFPPDAPGWQFYHPTSRRVLSSQDVTFDESVSYYHLFPHRTASPSPPPLFLAPGPPLVDPLPPQGPAPSGVSQVDPAEPVEVAVDSGAARGADPVGAETGGAESGGAEPGHAEPGGVAPEGTVYGGAEPARAPSGGALGVSSRREPLSPQRLREWYSWRCRVAAGAGAAAAGGAAGATGGAGAAGGAAGATGGAGAGAAGGAARTGDPGAEDTGSVSAVSGGTARRRPYFVPLLQQVLGSPPSPGPPPPPFLSPPPVQSQSQLQPASPLPSPSPYSGPTRGLTERREPESRPVSPESRPASPVRTVRAGRVSRPLARYSSSATAALGRLLLPYLFPELSAFTTVEDLVSHLRASDARYRTAVPAEFLGKNQPPMFITLYFIITRLPDSLRSVRDQFLSLDPTSLTIDLLAQHLLTAETSAVAVGAARGTPRPPFFEGCSSSHLAPSYASAAAADISVAEDVGAASASAKRRSGKGKGGKGGGGGSGGGGGGSGSSGGGSSGGGGGGGTGGGSGGSGGGGGGSGGSGSGGGSGTGGDGTGARRVGSGGSQRQQQQSRSETQSPQQLREWFLCGASGGSCPYVIRTGDHASQTCGRLHTQHRCFSRLDDAWRAEFGDDVELPCWADLLRSRIAIFDLDFDAILSAMYALSVSAEGDCYRCVPPDPGIAAAALGASESGTLPGTAIAQALHTFTLDSGASASFFRDSTTLTPLSTPVPVRLADHSGGPVVARSSTILPCPAVPSGSLSGLHIPSFSANLVSTAALRRVTICTCTKTGRHLATFTRRPGSSLYTLATEPPHVAASAQVSTSGEVAASCSCRLLSHQTLLWHHRLGHPSLPRLRGMHSCLLVSGLLRSLPPLPPLPAPPCLPCVEGRQRAAPHSSSFPTTTAPLQTLHMDVWGPARVSGQGREHYFLLVVDDCTRYTTVFPLPSKGQVVDVLIPWIRAVRLQLREGFGLDLPVLRMHSDRGGEFSSGLLRDFCRGEGIL